MTLASPSQSGGLCASGSGSCGVIILFCFVLSRVFEGLKGSHDVVVLAMSVLLIGVGGVSSDSDSSLDGPELLALFVVVDGLSTPFELFRSSLTTRSAFLASLVSLLLLLGLSFDSEIGGVDC